jgi:tight adherence protein B
MFDEVPIALILVLLAALVYLAVVLAMSVRRLSDTDSKTLARRIADVTQAREVAGEGETTDIVRRHEMSGLRWLDVLLASQAWSQRMNKVLDQADIQAPLGIFVLLSLFSVAFGYLIASIYIANPFIRLAVAFAPATVPFNWIFRRKRKRMAAFEAQLADALELVGRALKAGHTFGSGMGMVVSEFSDPIRVEFQKTMEEINLGLGVTVALDNLMDRVDCPDLNFFVVSVKIQHETGGNLAEIVENIAHLIRERFKLKGRVRVLSAEGRMAAWVLSLLPFGVSAAILALNPGYMSLLVTEPIGRKLLYLVSVMMSVGILTIRKMIRIEV